MTTPLRILHLDNNEADGELMRRVLVDGKIACEFVPAVRRVEFIAASERGNLDLILSDFPGPGADGCSALAHKAFSEVRSLFASSSLGNERAIESHSRDTAEGVPRSRSNGSSPPSAAQWTFPYTMIFIDCQTPEMDGLEATRLIRKRELDTGHACPWKSPVYIIAPTASVMQGDREKCLAVGMDDYVSKPMRLGELQAALERWQAEQLPPPDHGFPMLFPATLPETIPPS